MSESSSGAAVKGPLKSPCILLLVTKVLYAVIPFLKKWLFGETDRN